MESKFDDAGLEYSDDKPVMVPNPEPMREPFDPHMMPLDDEDDARYLQFGDPRRLEVERKRGLPFLGDE
jgi:hypothetical protein